MATETTYVKSIAADFTVGKGVNTSKLKTEINESSIVKGLKRINIFGDSVDMRFKDVLDSGEQTTLTNLVAAHDGTEIDQVQVVKIQEETTPTGGQYQLKSFKHVLAGGHGAETEMDISFPYSVSLLSAKLIGDTKLDKDVVNFNVSEDMDIGAVTIAVSIGDTQITVDDPALALVQLGHFLKIGTDEFGRVIAVDKSAKRVTFETAAIAAHSIGAAILRTVKLADGVDLPKSGVFTFGESTTGGSYISANTIIKMRFHSDNTAQAKDFLFYFEILY